MLSIKWVTLIEYYLRKCRGPIGGVWWGHGTSPLGLRGTIKEHHLEGLSRGYGPDGRALIQNAGACDHQIGWDGTYSADKSVAVLATWLPSILGLHAQAVDTANSYLTEVAVFTRRGKGGKILEHALPIVANFQELASNALEPLLHTHSVFLNVAGRADGTFGTILSKPLYEHKLTAGDLYKAELAYFLKHGLGLEIEATKHGFRIAGVPHDLIDRYSTRRKQILEQLQAKGLYTPKAAAIAAQGTRTESEELPPIEELLKLWLPLNTDFGFTEKVAQRLLGKAQVSTRTPNLSEQIAQAIEALLTSESHFSEQQLIRQVAKAVVAEGVRAREIIDQVRADLANNTEMVPLKPKGVEPRYTSREMLALESELLSIIKKGKTDTRHVVKDHIAKRELDKYLPLDPGLTEDERLRNEDQRNAGLQITTQPGQFKALKGVAGAGKSYLLGVANKIWSQAGFRVTGMAISGVVAARLQRDTGIECETIAMRLKQLDSKDDFVFHHKRQLKRLLKGKRTYAYEGRSFSLGKKDVVVIDEAGMVPTRQLLQIVRACKKAGANLVLVGDWQQLPPIEAGAPLRVVASSTGEATLDHVIRQKLEPDDPVPDWHRNAGQLIAAGHIAEAVKLFQERGRVSVLSNREDAMHSLVQDWSVQGIADPSNHIILASRRDEVGALNSACQAARLSADAVRSEHVTIAQKKFHVGDVVMFTKISRVFGVTNGDRGVVTGFNRLRKTVTVILERTQKPVHLSYRSYTDIDLAYAMTVHKAQGISVMSVYVLLGGSMQDRHLSYVQTTRASESTRLYVDRQSAGYGLGHLFRDMARERPKLLAHELLEAPASAEPSPPPAPASTGPVRAPSESSGGTLGAAPGHAAKAPVQSMVIKKPSSNQSANAPAEGGIAPIPNVVPKTLPPKPSPASKKLATASPRPAALDLPRAPSTNTLRTVDDCSGSSQATSSQNLPSASPQSAPRTSPPSTAGNASVVPLSKLDPPSRPVQLELPGLPSAAALPSNVSPQPSTPVSSIANASLSQSTSGSSDHKSAIAIPTTQPHWDSLTPKVSFAQAVRFGNTSNVQAATSAISRYGKLPGGIVVEGEAICDLSLKSIEFDPKRPAQLLINGCIAFDTGLDPEEIALLWHAVLETGRAATEFGVLLQQTVVGVEGDSLVAAAMMRADNALGAVVYGYDTQYRFAHYSLPSYRNPFLQEAKHASDPTVLHRRFINYLYEFSPKFFLAIGTAQFAVTPQSALVVTSMNVKGTLSAVDSDGIVMTGPDGSSLGARQFPFMHDALQLLASHVADYARAEPYLARTLAYAAVVTLLRRARSERAARHGREHVFALLKDRQHIALPRFDYNLRSEEFAKVARETAQRLSATSSNWFDGLMALVVGLEYAVSAGDLSSFLICKEKALSCIAALRRERHLTPLQQELSSSLPDLARRVRNSCYDKVIDRCLQAAQQRGRTKDERVLYLSEAVRRSDLSGSAKPDWATQCRWLEAKGCLDPNFDPVPGFADARRNEPSMLLPYFALGRVTSYRRYVGPGALGEAGDIARATDSLMRQLGVEKLQKSDLDELRALQAKLSDRAVFLLLDEIDRLQVPLDAYLALRRKQRAADPRRAILEFVATSLSSRQAGSFSTRYLHRLSPFFGSHQLLDHETPNALEGLVMLVMVDVEVFGSEDTRNASRREPPSLCETAEEWWYEFLWSVGSTQAPRSSKVAALIAHEMKARKLTVQQLYSTMQANQTRNPQAALFFHDLEGLA